MNKRQKNDLKAAVAKVEEATDTFRNIAGELQEEFDGKSEKWQESDKGQELEALKSDIEQAADDAEQITSNLSGHVAE